MKNLLLFSLLFWTHLGFSRPSEAIRPPLMAAPDFSVTTSDGQLKKLYQDYINQDKLVVVEAFFTSCPPCATHAPLLQNLYTSMQSAYPGQVEFILLSTLLTDTNVKVAQYKTNKGLTMPAVGKDGGSITALQPYLDGQFGDFQGTPTFFIIAPGSGEVFFDIRGNSPSQTMALLQAQIEALIPKTCKIESPFGDPLEAVRMDVRASAFDTAWVSNGLYELSAIQALQGSNYVVKPSKSSAPTGLTTYDLVLISKHILSLEPFQCPWQNIAADVNCTGSVTTFDIVTARKVILGIADTFPCGSWRFVPDSAALSNGSCQDFMGVRLGDVNAGPCNDSLMGAAESRGAPENLYFLDQYLSAGETAQVELFLGKTLDLEGLQFALDFDPNALQINTISTENLSDFSADNYSLNTEHFALSWLQVLGQTISAEKPLLRFEMTAKQAGKLSDLLQYSRTLQPEAYDKTGKIHPLNLSYWPVSTRFAISPNPAQTQFKLQAQLEQAGTYWMQLIDIQGKIVLARNLTATPGLNTWDLNLPENAPGLYFLKMNGLAAGKLVVLGF